MENGIHKWCYLHFINVPNASNAQSNTRIKFAQTPTEALEAMARRRLPEMGYHKLKVEQVNYLYQVALPRSPSTVAPTTIGGIGALRLLERLISNTEGIMGRIFDGSYISVEYKPVLESVVKLKTEYRPEGVLASVTPPFELTPPIDLLNVIKENSYNPSRCCCETSCDKA